MDAAETAETPGPRGAPEPRVSFVHALSWSAISTLGVTALTLLRSAVLARLLRPEEFGLFGLVVFALSAVGAFTELGLNRAAVIRQHGGAEEQRRFLDTAWTVQLLRGAGLMFLIALLAWPYAKLMEQPRLWPLLAVGASSLLVNALASPALLLLFQELKQKSLAILKLASNALGLGVAVLAAWLSPSPWPLLFGYLVTAAVSAALSYAVHPYRPRLRLDRELLKSGFAQGRYVALAGAMTFVTTQVDNAIVGRFLGAATLGIYLFAYRLPSLPLDQLGSVITSVALPAWLRTRAEGAAALSRHARRLISPSAVVCGAAMLSMTLLRRELVLVFGGKQWLEAVPLIAPLCLLCLLRGLTINLGVLLHAVERVELDARGRVIEGIFFTLVCAGGVLRFGVQGAAWAGVLTYALALTLRSRSVAVALPGEGAAITGAWARPAIAAAACTGAGLLAESAGAPALLIAPGALATFLALALRLDPELPAELRRLYSRLPLRRALPREPGQLGPHA